MVKIGNIIRIWYLAGYLYTDSYLYSSIVINTLSIEREKV